MATGFTPFQLVYGREAKLPTHLLTADIGPTDHDGETGYVESLRQKLRKIYDAARDANRRASATQKLQHDKHVNPANLQSGEEVFLKRPTARPGLTPKLTPKYRGPYTLTCILGKNGLIGPTWKDDVGSPRPSEASQPTQTRRF